MTIIITLVLTLLTSTLALNTTHDLLQHFRLAFVVEGRHGDDVYLDEREVKAKKVATTGPKDKSKQRQCDDRTKRTKHKGNDHDPQFSTLFWTNPKLSTFFISTNEMF
jgi:hypothetical protein